MFTKEVCSYHFNHLGSASWITDHTGQPVQHLQYLPYGEPFINQRLSNYNERFTFTSKERDEETGYGYFGARYMDHELTTMWLSIDPMSDKYPSISPYAYCAWNPVKLVDPDGEEFIGALIGAVVKASASVVSQTITNGFKNLNDGNPNTSFFSNWSSEMDWADVLVEGVKGAMDGFVPGASLLVDIGGEVVKAGVDLHFDEGKISGDVLPASWSEFGLKAAQGVLTTLTCRGLSAASGQSGLITTPFARCNVTVADCAVIAVADGAVNSLIGLPFSYGKDAIMERTTRTNKGNNQLRKGEVKACLPVKGSYEYNLIHNRL